MHDWTNSEKLHLLKFSRILLLTFCWDSIRQKVTMGTFHPLWKVCSLNLAWDYLTVLQKQLYLKPNPFCSNCLVFTLFSVMVELRSSVATWKLDTLDLSRKSKALFSSPPFLHYCTAKTENADPREISVRDFVSSFIFPLLLMLLRVYIKQINGT